MSGRISFDRLTAFWRDLIGGQVDTVLHLPTVTAIPDPAPVIDEPDFRWWIVTENPHYGWPDDLVEEARQARDRYMQQLHDALREDQRSSRARPRFKSMPGGAVIEVETGRAMAHVAVTQLDTSTAERVSTAINIALEGSAA